MKVDWIVGPLSGYLSIQILGIKIEAIFYRICLQLATERIREGIERQERETTNVIVKLLRIQSRFIRIKSMKVSTQRMNRRKISVRGQKQQVKNDCVKE